jgi:hypothetical protein
MTRKATGRSYLSVRTAHTTAMRATTDGDEPRDAGDEPDR